jgi:dTDP-glucose 4,6-dehydratase
MSLERMIVTGGAGFIGSNFIRYQLREYPNQELIIVDKFTYAANPASISKLEPKIKIIKGDICDRDLMHEVIKEGDTVVNFAAESHVDRSNIDSNPFMRTNVEGTRNLLEVSRLAGVQLFVQISTDEVYGSLVSTDPPSREDDSHKPTSPYSLSKSLAEGICQEYMGHFPIIITRSSNNYGPFQNPEKFIPRAITNLIEGKRIPMYGDGKNVRDWIHVEDNCVAIDNIISAVQNDSRNHPTVFNIGGMNQTSNIGLARIMLKIMGLTEDQIEYVQDRPNHDLRYDLDCSRIRTFKLLRTPIPLEDGLAQTVQWYKEHEAWWKSSKEIAENEVYRKK